MCRASVLIRRLFFVLAFAGASAPPLLAADLGPPRQTYRTPVPYSDDALAEREVAEFCYRQRWICRKVCDLRSSFEDRLDGCSHSCDIRATRCTRTGRYRWMDPDFVIAEKLGASRRPN